MKKSWVFLKANWQILVEYRADLIIWGLSSIIIPFLGLAIWLTISSQNFTLSLSKSDLIIYFLVVALLNVFTSAWSSWFINEQIINGGFSKYLTKPFSALLDNLMENLAEKILKMIAILPVILIIFRLLLSSAHLFNLSPLMIILFIVSSLNAFIITFLLDVTVGLTGFWFHDVDFLNNLLNLLEHLFTGVLIPIVFLPRFLYNLALYLPFRYMVSFPAEIFLRKVEGPSLWMGMLIQSFWLVMIIIIYKLIFKFGTKYYQGYGG